jgi:hypothetical protein
MPRGKTQAVLSLIDICAEILEQIQPASVRAVCYQLFVRELIESTSKACPFYTARDATVRYS